MTSAELETDLTAAARSLKALGERAARLWEAAQVPPQRWRCQQYPGVPAVWVVGIAGSKCLYYNPVEEGWGWGRFERLGIVVGYHWEQVQLQQAVLQGLYTADTE